MSRTRLILGNGPPTFLQYYLGLGCVFFQTETVWTCLKEGQWICQVKDTLTGKINIYSTDTFSASRDSLDVIILLWTKRSEIF